MIIQCRHTNINFMYWIFIMSLETLAIAADFVESALDDLTALGKRKKKDVNRQLHSYSKQPRPDNISDEELEDTHCFQPSYVDEDESNCEQLGAKAAHNQLEKYRRAHLKLCFRTLKSKIPAMAEKKMSDLGILRGALKHIQSLKKSERDLIDQKKILSSELCRHLKQVGELRKKLRDSRIPFNQYFFELFCSDEDTRSASTASAEGESPILSDVEQHSDDETISDPPGCFAHRSDRLAVADKCDPDIQSASKSPSSPGVVTTPSVIADQLNKTTRTPVAQLLHQTITSHTSMETATTSHSAVSDLLSAAQALTAVSCTSQVTTSLLSDITHRMKFDSFLPIASVANVAAANVPTPTSIVYTTSQPIMFYYPLPTQLNSTVTSKVAESSPLQMSNMPMVKPLNSFATPLTNPIHNANSNAQLVNLNLSALLQPSLYPTGKVFINPGLNVLLPSTPVCQTSPSFLCNTTAVIVSEAAKPLYLHSSSSSHLTNINFVINPVLTTVGNTANVVSNVPLRAIPKVPNNIPLLAIQKQPATNGILRPIQYQTQRNVTPRVIHQQNQRFTLIPPILAKTSSNISINSSENLNKITNSALLPVVSKHLVVESPTSASTYSSTSATRLISMTQSTGFETAGTSVVNSNINRLSAAVQPSLQVAAVSSAMTHSYTAANLSLQNVIPSKFGVPLYITNQGAGNGQKVIVLPSITQVQPINSVNKT